jgi:hypothetical protein
MRDYFRTRTISVPIPTEPELYIAMALVIMFAMWVVVR